LNIFKVIKEATGDLADNVVRKIINGRIENYGTVQSLKINRELREIEISLTLHGEADPVRVVCRKYSFHAIKETLYAKVESFSACRPWLESILNDFAARKPFPLDHPRAKMIPIYLNCNVHD
jgi:hypothetical protein